jgi:hypothetical protein
VEDRAAAAQRLAADDNVKKIGPAIHAGPGRGKKTDDNGNRFGSNSAEYLVRRLKRDATKTIEDVASRAKVAKPLLNVGPPTKEEKNNGSNTTIVGRGADYLTRRIARDAPKMAKSGWTQQKIAERIGKDQSWVALTLRFGKFLEHVMTSGHNTLAIPQNLTERRFREYWNKTHGPSNECRFDKVLAAITTSQAPPQSQPSLESLAAPKLAPIHCVTGNRLAWRPATRSFDSSSRGHSSGCGWPRTGGRSLAVTVDKCDLAGSRTAGRPCP